MSRIYRVTSACVVLASAIAFDTIAAAQVTTLPVNRCLAAKIKCAGAYAAAVAKCDTKAAKKTGAVDPDCISTAAGKLSNGTNGCLEKAVALGDCTDGSTQVDALQGSADSFLLEVACELDPTNDACDSTAPETILTLVPPPRTNDATADFQFQSPDAGAVFECALDGAAFGDCSSPLGTSSLPEGFHFFQVRSIDLAGNVDSTPATSTWLIDFTPPDTILTEVEPDPSESPNGHFQFHSNDGPALFTCSLDGAPFTSCSSPWVTEALPTGVHTFEVRAADFAGNLEPAPASHTWTIVSPGP